MSIVLGKVMCTKLQDNSFYARVPARVLGCLNNGEITVIISAGHGIVLVEPIPVNWIPRDLRMPNCEFDILMRFPGGERVRVLRANEAYADLP
jgi:hypothetical protein